MSSPGSRLRMGVTVAVAAGVGAFVGLVVGYLDWFPRLPRAEAIYEYPLPHHVPKFAGGVSLRFAMVHDVLHERYARHGIAYYQERNRSVRADLATPNLPNDKYLALADDLGAGLDALRDDDEAVRVLREKLRLQESLEQSGRQLYTTYANLGTFLIHGAFPKAVGGDAAAKEQVREGLAFLHKSIEVNPSAHFGREIWQAVAAEYLLAALEKPGILLQFDMVGDRLDAEIDPRKERSLQYGYASNVRWRSEVTPEALERSRKYITQVGAEMEWKEAASTSQSAPVPFDEPTLGIIGMWRLGGGANPHFALALGEIMMRVGQRHIAWCAYERAAQLADRVWPDAAIQTKFVEHCRKRQSVIERQLPEEERKELRPRFDSELAYGRRYQEEYQAYEAKRIGEGASLDDDHFYDAFLAEHEPIASPVGDEEYIQVTPGTWPAPNVVAIVLFAGIFAFVAACLYRLIKRRAAASINTTG